MSLQNSLTQLRRMNSSFNLDNSALQEDSKFSTKLKGRSVRSIRRIRQEQQDQDLLHRTLQDACQFAYGTQMVEVWVWNPMTSKLTRPEGGWWIDPYWQFDTAVFCQFVDAKSHDYIAPPALSPGVGVPGVLWSDLRTTGRDHHHGGGGGHGTRRSRKSGGGGNSSALLDSTFLAQIFSDDNNHNGNNQYLGGQRIAWRDLKALANDPDQPPNRRLQVLASSTDLKWTGGVPFSIQGQEGIVVYYAREGTNVPKLQDPTNTTYLTAASDFVGSCLALRIPRRNAIARRQCQVDRNFRKVKRAILFLIRNGADFESISKGKYDWDNQQQHHHQFNNNTTTELDPNDQIQEVTTTTKTSWTQQAVTFLTRKSKQSISKFKGAATQAPPTFTWEMSGFTSMGVLLSMVAVSIVNELFLNKVGTHYQIPMGSMAALLALQFGLTAAPAAQPRMVLQGQVVSMLMALLCAQLKLAPWFQQSLACALAIGAMAKVGVVNPPAAANAYIFASGTWGFGNMLSTLIANLIAILCSVFINNLSDNRQYPTSWGIPQLFLSRDMVENQMEQDREDTVTILLRRARSLRKMKSFGRASSFSGSGAGDTNKSTSDDNINLEEEIIVFDTTVNTTFSKQPEELMIQSSLSEETPPPGDKQQDPPDFENSINITTAAMSDDDMDEEMGGAKPSVRFAEDSANTIISMDGTTGNDSAGSSSKPQGRHRRSPAAASNMFI
ncbi:CBS domain containing membrane protein [Seminavis robusta]|uniref:CBS domain containing membrane protein n=1 Tax=Seminavis robusta TaxID=568900 RepID=A0A9N8DJQ5_9STRA|nr:CBS domain containing membrane protein [Seminavis robusta]|eukprot:Sro181_g078990.1 CBS domain containing membrane protein (724) ;mRNA; r:15767-17938